jgi:hypothetical protein
MAGGQEGPTAAHQWPCDGTWNRALHDASQVIPLTCPSI